MGANVTPSRIVKAGKALATVHHICHVFEQQTLNHLHSGKHNAPGFSKDPQSVVEVLKDVKTFEFCPKRAKRYTPPISRKKVCLSKSHARNLPSMLKMHFQV